MKNTVEKIIKRSIKICKNWKILTRNKNFTAGQKMGANALLFFLINTFYYFSQTFLKCFKLDIFNLNYNQFFKEVATNINNICTSLINHFAKFNLVLKCFYLVKDKNLQTL